MKKLWFSLIMIDETMLPRKGLIDRTFSVFAEIKHPDNSTKLADIYSVWPALSKRLTESLASYIYNTNGKLKMT